MSTILDTIIASKRLEIEKFKPKSPVDRFERDGFFWKFTTRSLRASLEAPGSTGIIAEFKRKSPSKGWFKPKELEVEKVLRAYNDFGAAAASVLTDEPFFGGDLDDLIQAKVISDIPILRKDFIVDPWQIAEARAFGADVILLIAACLTPAEVKSLAEYAKSLELSVLLELHDEEELGHICDATDIIGINNRNLKTFEVDIERSLRMAKQIPDSKIKVAESGISDIDTIKRFRDEGFKGFLIGENFMKEPDPGEAFKAFVEKLKVS
ncbi:MULTISPECIES: indole-3-glycerol phosphate synthase TrpC [unclassified Paraflavitalea]|uniref:indole-3-glycerol phosphate synthase TrpC n=1 Tax=unclassified Paraflavitalea TaxID=2798305 RepID=UPI003D3504E8